MAAADFRLRAYQVEVLDRLARYLRRAQTLGARTAFIDQTNVPFTAAPFLDPEIPMCASAFPPAAARRLWPRIRSA